MVEGLGSSTTNLTVNSSKFTAATGDVFQYIGNGDGGGALNVNSSQFSNNDPSIGGAGGGVTLSGGAKANTTLNVANSTFRDSITAAITIAKSRDAADTGNVTGTINGNTIGVDRRAPTPARSGGSGIDGTNFGRGNMTLDITNNNVRQYNSSGLSFTAGAGLAETGQMNLWFAGNSIAEPGTNPSVTLFQGIRVNSGVTAGDNFDTCVDFGAGNSIAGSGDPANGGDWRLRANESNIRVPGYAGALDRRHGDDELRAEQDRQRRPAPRSRPAGDGVWAGGATCPRP